MASDVKKLLPEPNRPSAMAKVLGLGNFTASPSVVAINAASHFLQRLSPQSLFDSSM